MAGVAGRFSLCPNSVFTVMLLLLVRNATAMPDDSRTCRFSFLVKPLKRTVSSR